MNQHLYCKSVFVTSYKVYSRNVKSKQYEKGSFTKKLQNIITNGDDHLLETLCEVAKEYEGNYELSEEDLKELNERRNKYLSGESKSYTWEEAKQIIMQKKVVKNVPGYTLERSN